MPTTKNITDKKAVVHGDAPPELPASSFEVAMLLLGIAMLLIMFYLMQSIWSPFLLLGSILFLLYPLRGYSAAKNIIWLSIFIFLIWFFATIEGILAPFLISLFLSYILHPLVTRIERFHVPRWTSALFIILCFIALSILLLLAGLPIVLRQFEGIIQAISSISNQFTEWVLEGKFAAFLRKYGISTAQLQKMISTSIAPRLEDIIKGLLQGTFNIVSEVKTIITGVVNIVIIPFLTFYMLKDFPLVKHRIKMLIPRSRREQTMIYWGHIDDMIGHYIRGTTIMAIIQACAVTAAFWLIGLQYPLVLGVLAGLLWFVPYFGTIIMLVVATVVSTMSPPPVALHVIFSLGTIVLLDIIQNYVISPRVIGDKVGLHPVVLILSLFVFGYFLGFIGLLIAIPAAGSIIVIVKEWEENRKKTILKEDLPPL